MLSNLSEMFRQWRFWKRKRRRERRRTLSSPALNIGDSRGFGSLDPAYLDLAVSSDDLWLVEDELQALEKTTARLLEKLSQQPDDPPTSAEEECVVCVNGRSCMQTFPCGHCVLCRKCFIRTIQVAVSDRKLPLRCVICRSKIVRLKQQNAGKRLIIRKQQTPPLYYQFSQATPSAHPPSGILQPAYL